MLRAQPATSGDQHEIRWIAGSGGVGGELSPIVITASLTSEACGATIKIRGVGKEEGPIKPWSAARTAVDTLVGMLADLFDPYDILDFTG